jgi:hypothetical protein
MQPYPADCHAWGCSATRTARRGGVPQRPPLAPLGRRRTRQGDKLGLGGTVENAPSGRVGRMLTGKGGVDPTLHQLLARAGHGVDAGIQRLGDPPVTPRLIGLRGVGLQQDARLQRLAGRTFALLDQCVEPLAVLVAELDDVPLHGRLFRGHDASPRGAGEIDSEIGRRINDGEH